MDKISKIVITLPVGDLVLSSVSGSYKILHTAIELQGGGTALLIAGSTPKQTVDNGLFTIHPHIHFSEIDRADLIIVPAIKSDIHEAISANQQLSQWLLEQYQQGAHIASLCSGAFLLGSAGLLKDRQCTTHWMHEQEFRQAFPDTRYRQHNIITEDERIFSSGGAFTFLNLIIYLTERFFGKEIATQLISIFQIDYPRRSQDRFVLFNTQKDHLDTAVILAQQFIEQHFMQKLTIQQIADAANLSKRTLVRRFQAACGNTPNQYLQRVRIEKAKELLTNTDKHIGEIQFLAGYNDAKTFRNIFLKLTGLTPMAYRRKYTVVQ